MSCEYATVEWLNLILGRVDIYRTVVFVALQHAHLISMAD